MSYQLQLEIISAEDSGFKVPLVVNDTNFKIQKLERKIFTFESSPGDKLYFKKELFNYMISPIDEYKPLHEFMWGIIWERNEKGKYCKYMYFNERSQKLYIDRDFFSWCKLISEVMMEHIDNWGL